MRRFVQEAKSASALNHPNIVTVHDVGQSDSIRFIVTEHVEGDTLRARIRQGPLPLLEVLNVAIQIASALAEAHKAGIIHCDIKPGEHHRARRRSREGGGFRPGQSGRARRAGTRSGPAYGNVASSQRRDVRSAPAPICRRNRREVAGSMNDRISSASA